MDTSRRIEVNVRLVMRAELNREVMAQTVAFEFT